MRSIPTAFWLIMSLSILIGCSQDSVTVPERSAEPVATTPDPTKTSEQTLINNYVVQYDGRTFDGAETTFRYTVYGTGVEPALSHFMLELPGCAPPPSSFSPINSVSINTSQETGIYGIEWHLAVEADDTVGREYSVTFPGDVARFSPSLNAPSGLCVNCPAAISAKKFCMPLAMLSPPSSRSERNTMRLG
mgnify:CR=1 FL=1